MPGDEKLLTAIRAEADRAADMRPESLHLGTIAQRLAGAYPHQSYDEIYSRLEDAFRARGTFWT